jgi:hypothetical protein
VTGSQAPGQPLPSPLFVAPVSAPPVAVENGPGGGTGPATVLPSSAGEIETAVPALPVAVLPAFAAPVSTPPVAVESGPESNTSPPAVVPPGGGIGNTAQTPIENIGQTPIGNIGETPPGSIIQPVPEPAGLMMLATALAAMLALGLPRIVGRLCQAPCKIRRIGGSPAVGGPGPRRCPEERPSLGDCLAAAALLYSAV